MSHVNETLPHLEELLEEDVFRKDRLIKLHVPFEGKRTFIPPKQEDSFQPLSQYTRWILRGDLSKVCGSLDPWDVGGTAIVFKGEFQGVESAVLVPLPQKILIPKHQKDEQLGTRLKHLIEDFAMTDGSVARFAQNMPGFLHFGELALPDSLSTDAQNSVPFFIQEFIRGVTARDYLHWIQVKEERNLAPQDVVTIIGSAAETVHELHEAGLAHLDLQPSNLLLTENDVYVLDLGNAWPLAAEPYSKKPQDDWCSLTGERHVVPPEALTFLNRYGKYPASKKTDIFGLSATAYFLLTGRWPYDFGAPLPGDHGRKLVGKSADESIIPNVYTKLAKHALWLENFKVAANSPARQRAAQVLVDQGVAWPHVHNAAVREAPILETIVLNNIDHLLRRAANAKNFSQNLREACSEGKWGRVNRGVKQFVQDLPFSGLLVPPVMLFSAMLNVAGYDPLGIDGPIIVDTLGESLKNYGLLLGKTLGVAYALHTGFGALFRRTGRIKRFFEHVEEASFDYGGIKPYCEEKVNQLLGRFSPFPESPFSPIVLRELEKEAFGVHTSLHVLEETSRRITQGDSLVAHDYRVLFAYVKRLFEAPLPPNYLAEDILAEGSFVPIQRPEEISETLSLAISLYDGSCPKDLAMLYCFDGDLCSSLGAFEEAAYYYQQASEVLPEDPVLHFLSSRAEEFTSQSDKEDIQSNDDSRSFFPLYLC